MKRLRRCKNCGRWFAMKMTEKKLIRKEEAQIFERLTQPHLKGGIDTSVERYVSGERHFYDITYVCKNCGAQEKETIFENVKK